nr:MAG TPA: anti-sigma factor [Bacteriophage sp.]
MTQKMIVIKMKVNHVVVMTNDELIDKTDKAITELVYPKWDL